MSASEIVKPPRIVGTRRGRAGFQLAAIVLLGLGVRLIGIDGAGFWTDELFSVVWSRQPLAFLWGQGMAVETNPPLYYTLLHEWLKLAGSGEAAVRLPGVMASAAAIPALFLLMRELSGTRPALLAALLLAVAPVQVAFAQEARAYALMPLLVTLATLGLLRFARGGGWPALLLYGVAAVLLGATHATSVFILATLNLGCLGALLLGRQWGRLPAWLVANTAVAAISAPILLAMARQTGSGNIAWITPPNLHLLIEIPAVLLVDPATPLVHFRSAVAIAALLGAALAAALYRKPPPRAALLFLALPAAGFLLAMLLVSLRLPVLIPRVTIWLSVPLAGLTALALRDRVNAMLLVPPLLLCGAVGLHGVWLTTPQTKQDWRGLMAELTPRLSAADDVAVGMETFPFGVTFYGGPRPVLRWLPQPPVADALLQAANRLLTVTPLTTGQMAARARSGHVWLILDELDLELNRATAQATFPPPREVLRNHPGLEAWGW